MNIQLKYVVPLPLKDIISDSHPVWNTEFNFLSGTNYQVSARSGVGKTTLLSLIYGVRKDYSGDVFIGEQALKQMTAKDHSYYRQNKISMVFQGLQLFDDLSVRENIHLKNKLTQHLSVNEISTMMEALEISPLKDKKTAHISYGQKQRVAIIRALCQPFQWLLLDEPFSHLDPATSQLTMDLITTHAQNQDAGIIVTSLSPQSLNQSFKPISI
jgi:putative ABC transport system ATP-binding protein